jgi:hypothetical protein
MRSGRSDLFAESCRIGCPRVVNVSCTPFDRLAWSLVYGRTGRGVHFCLVPEAALDIPPKFTQKARELMATRMRYRNWVKGLVEVGVVPKGKECVMMCCKPAGAVIEAFSPIEYTCKQVVCPFCHYRKIIKVLKKSTHWSNFLKRPVSVLKLSMPLELCDMANRRMGKVFRLEHTRSVLDRIRSKMSYMGLESIRIQRMNVLGRGHEEPTEARYEVHYLGRGFPHKELWKRVSATLPPGWARGGHGWCKSVSSGALAMRYAMGYPAALLNTSASSAGAVIQFTEKMRSYQTLGF